MDCRYCPDKLGLKVEIIRHYSLDDKIDVVKVDGKEGFPTFILSQYTETKAKFLYPTLECLGCGRKFYEAGSGATFSADGSILTLPNLEQKKLKSYDLWGQHSTSTEAETEQQNFVLKERPRTVCS